jgi:hypothetical protein
MPAADRSKDAGVVQVPRLLTESEAAIVLRVSPRTLTSWRSSGRYGLRYAKIGGRVVYEQAALRDFIESRTITRRTRGNSASHISRKWGE